MNYNIRSFKNSDYEEIASWWVYYINQKAPKNFMIENGTFILEIKGVPALCLTTFLTQNKEVAYLSSFIKNPLFKEASLEYYGKIMWDYCSNYAKEKGYKRVICFTNIDKLKSKYQKFGMNKTMDGLSSFVKEF